MSNSKFNKKREEIKEAGIKSFSAYGYYKTTLEDIANMLGMKKNSLYYYFESKEALFKELVEDEIKFHSEFVNKINSLDIPADKKIEKIIDGLIEFIRERTIKYTVKLSAYIEIHRVVLKEYKEFHQRECKIIENILKEGTKNGIFKKHDSNQIAKDIEYLVPSMFRSYYTDSDKEFVSEVDFEFISKTIKRIFRYILNGIKS